jgi:3-oxoacyl-[acyl-carrier-protein] synthase II
MLVGGSEAPLNPTVFGAFIKSGLLSLRFPFWQDNVIKREGCSGSVLSEGACVLVLESYENALRRGAPIYAEILASGASSDGYDMVAPHPSGRGIVVAIQQAINRAGICAEDIDLVMGHFPGLRSIYDIEMRALRREFGKRIQSIPISNVKPLIGYTQGACAAFEIAAACQTFQMPTQLVTYGTSYPSIKATCSLINCIGFGGKNASIILKAPDRPQT